MKEGTPTTDATLVALLRATLGTEEPPDSRRLETCDWTRLERLAAHHAVGPTVVACPQRAFPPFSSVELAVPAHRLPGGPPCGTRADDSAARASRRHHDASGPARDRPPASTREAPRPEPIRRGACDGRGTRLQGSTCRARIGLVEALPRGLPDDADRAGRPRGARPHRLTARASRGAPRPRRTLRPGLLPEQEHLQPSAAHATVLRGVRLL